MKIGDEISHKNRIGVVVDMPLGDDYAVIRFDKRHNEPRLLRVKKAALTYRGKRKIST